MDEVTQHIKQRAYEIYLARGTGHGRDLDDWLQAEKDVTAAMGMAPSPPEEEVGENKAAPARVTKAAASTAKSARGKAART